MATIQQQQQEIKSREYQEQTQQQKKQFEAWLAKAPAWECASWRDEWQRITTEVEAACISICKKDNKKSTAVVIE